jgi:hypothetical protein
MNQQNTINQALLPDGLSGYAWLLLPQPIQTNDGLASYAVLTIRVGRNLEWKPCGPGFHCQTEEEAKKLFEHLVATRPNVARFKIYGEGLFNQQCQKEINKRQAEAKILQDLLWHLEYFIKLDQVDFGEPPNEPDFIFTLQGKQIGAELTALDPKVFATGGYRQRGEFKKWQKETNPTVTPEKFLWGSYSLRESLIALKAQIDEKRKKVKQQRSFLERWLLIHVANGSPFSQIFGGKYQTVPGREKQIADFVAKSASEVHAICKEAKPFDYVMFFDQDGFLTFPTSSINPYKLPAPSGEVLERGAKASDEFLDWQKKINSYTKSAETKEGNCN